MKPVHKVIVRDEDFDYIACDWFWMRRGYPKHYTTEDSGVTCKNCLRAMNRPRPMTNERKG